MGFCYNNYRFKIEGLYGHLEACHDNIYKEIFDCAVLAATGDSRFLPLSLAEFEMCRIEISLLHTPEKVKGPSDLDPMVYGVIVTQDAKRGALLPKINGIIDAKKQISIAADKANINLTQPYELFRYRVEKIEEDAAGAASN